MKKEKIIFAALSIAAGAIALSALVWAFIAYPSEQVLGERFVKDEINIIPGLILFKPVTIIVISTFVSWMCALEALRENIVKLPFALERFIFVSLCLIAFVFSYEVAWNFLMWTSAHVINPNLPLDFLSHQLNLFMKEPINFVSATKFYALVLAISLYSIFFLHTNRKQTRKS